MVAVSLNNKSDPEHKDENFEPALSKIYRHPTFYEVPEEVGHM